MEAISVLAKQPHLDNEVIDALIAQLDDKMFLEHLEDATKYQKKVFEALAKHPQARDELFQLLLMQHHSVRALALGELGSLPQPNRKILDMVRAQPAVKDCEARRKCISTLERNPNLNHKILDAIAERLDDKVESVRWEALMALNRQRQLNHNIFEVIKSRAQNRGEYWRVRVVAIEILVSRQQVNDVIQNMIIAELHDGNLDSPSPMLCALKNCLQPNDEIVDAVVAQLEESFPSTKVVVLSVLRNWLELNDTILEAIVKQLDNDASDVKRSAAEAFEGRPQPKDHIIEMILMRLRDSKLENSVRVPLLYALSNWTRLHSDVLYYTAELLGSASYDKFIMRVVVKILQAQPQPGNEVTDVISGYLTDPDVREAALEAMGSWDRLSDKHLAAVIACLKVESAIPAAVRVLLIQSSLPFEKMQPFMESMYSALTLRCVRQHVYWVIENGQSFIMIGARKIEWKMATANTTNDYTSWLREDALRWKRRTF
ncbi:hypothetical protein M426DRAFT_17656 [Hypoxylon sp. CI-4A]|nr:hypothetical protein M426DRAFT_17656 [Hypoxylon sp. CI-4A]